MILNYSKKTENPYCTCVIYTIKLHGYEKCICNHFTCCEICKSDDVHTEATANQYLQYVVAWKDIGHKRGQHVCHVAAAVGKKERLGRK